MKYKNVLSQKTEDLNRQTTWGNDEGIKEIPPFSLTTSLLSLLERLDCSAPEARITFGRVDCCVFPCGMVSFVGVS